MENKPKTAVKKVVAPKAKTVAKVTDIESVAVKTETTESTTKTTANAPKEKSTFAKVVTAGVLTSKIVRKAGEKILGSSLKTTKTIAGIYKKAGKSAFKLGKEAFAETTVAVVSNQKTVREASAKAFKETVETIKESHLIDNPLKAILKSKKNKK